MKKRTLIAEYIPYGWNETKKEGIFVYASMGCFDVYVRRKGSVVKRKFDSIEDVDVYIKSLTV